jgi:phytoene synthase
LQGRYSDKFRLLAESIDARAKQFYSAAKKALPAEDRKNMVAAELMGMVYWRLLKKLERAQFDVFGPQPVGLSKPQKLALIFQSWLRFCFGIAEGNYGNR